MADAGSLVVPGGNAPGWVSEEDPEEIASSLQSTVSTLDASPYEANRRRAMCDDLGLFHGEAISNLYQVATYEGALRSRQDLIAFNVCYSIISTIINRICSFRVRAQFLPNGGDHK